ncbi:ATP-dependent DNA helicase RecQ [Alkalibacterium iburiense]|uniref:ATP-dependent DNA helicase RecQ n=1 Tax=Alkalibacterium iburiense TaxID=290589 RepID=A0ABN0X7X7_9LACT
MTRDTIEATVRQALKTKFGFSSFRPGQKEAILSVLNKRNSLVMLPTGTGKSLCYQLPSYFFKGKTLIISPLLSLMEDQVERMKREGEKSVVALNSFMTQKEKRLALRQLDTFKFIFLSPEMILQDYVLNRLKQLDISLLVIDEAHCISQWGMDFRPDYLKLGRIRMELGNPLTMALTATAVEKVRQEILEQLHLDKKDTDEIIYSVNRPSIQLRTEICHGNKNERLFQLINEIKGPGIIYFSSKKMADKWAEQIREETDLLAESYHSDLENEDKKKIQAQFLSNTVHIICATSAFGMGIDKPDIRFVIHYHLPSNPETYLQEVGRCSRDKKGGVAVLLYEAGDERLQSRLQSGSLPTRDELRYCYKYPERLPSLKEESKIDIARYFIEQSIPFQTAWETIEERWVRKKRQLQFMVHYVHVESCKRTCLLHYFNEKVINDQDPCCSYCNRAFVLHVPESKFEKNLNENQEKPWKSVLKNLFNLESEPI